MIIQIYLSKTFFKRNVFKPNQKNFAYAHYQLIDFLYLFYREKQFKKVELK